MTSTQDSHHSSQRERLIEHLVLGEIMRHLWLRDVTNLEVLDPQVDSAGYDLVMEANGIVRHVQLKSRSSTANTRKVSVSQHLGQKPSGCVVWVQFESSTMRLGPFLWLGGAPGKPLPSLSEFKTAKQTRANSRGVKAERLAFREVPLSRFERLTDVAALVERLFGPYDRPKPKA